MGRGEVCFIFFVRFSGISIFVYYIGCVCFIMTRMIVVNEKVLGVCGKKFLR